MVVHFIGVHIIFIQKIYGIFYTYLINQKTMTNGKKIKSNVVAKRKDKKKMISLPLHYLAKKSALATKYKVKPCEIEDMLNHSSLN